MIDNYYIDENMGVPVDNSPGFFTQRTPSDPLSFYDDGGIPVSAMPQAQPEPARQPNVATIPDQGRGLYSITQEQARQAIDFQREQERLASERERASNAAQQAPATALPDVKTVSDLEAYDQGLQKWKDKDGTWHFKYERPESLRPGGAGAKKYQEKADDESARIARATGIDPTKPPDLGNPHDEAMTKMRDWMRSVGDNTSDTAIAERVALDPRAAHIWSFLQKGAQADYQNKTAKYALAKESFDKAMGAYTAQTKTEKPVGTLTERVNQGTGVKSYGQAPGGFAMKGGGVVATDQEGNTYVMPGIGAEKANTEQIKAELDVPKSRLLQTLDTRAAQIGAMDPEAVKKSTNPVVKQVWDLQQRIKTASEGGGSGADKQVAILQDQIRKLVATPEDMAQYEQEIQAIGARYRPDTRTPVYSITDKGLKYTAPQGEGLPKGGRGNVQTAQPKAGRSAGSTKQGTVVVGKDGRKYVRQPDPKTGTMKWVPIK